MPATRTTLRSVAWMPGPELEGRARAPLAGLAAAAASVAVATLVIYPLREVAPAVSTGRRLPARRPAGRHALGPWPRPADGAGQRARLQLLPHPADRASSRSPTARTGSRWRVFLVAAVDRRRRSPSARASAPRRPSSAAREADLAAELARLLLGGDEPRRGARGRRRSACAEALELPSAAIELARGRGRRAATSRSRCATARAASATLLVPRPRSSRDRWRASQERVVPALEALLARGARARARCWPRWSRPRRCAAATCEDRAAAGGLARPAHAADRDRRRPARRSARRPAERGAARSLRRRSSPEAARLVAPGRQAARPLAAWRPAPPSRAATGARSRRSSQRRPSELGPTADGVPRHRSATTCRWSRPTPPSSSAPSPTCSRTRAATPAGSRSRCAARRGRRPASWSGSSTAARASRRASCAHVFEPFYRGGTDGAGTRAPGSGWRSSRGFVEANGGRVGPSRCPARARPS